jgi:hypothetical protein
MGSRRLTLFEGLNNARRVKQDVEGGIYLVIKNAAAQDSLRLTFFDHEKEGHQN